MSKPQSVKVDPWSDWPKQPYSFINDDFVHDKTFTAKVNAKGTKSTANFKASVTQDKSGFKLADELKFWFDLPQGRSLYGKVKSSDYIKGQFDNGITEQWGRKWNFYASWTTNKSLSNAKVSLGANHPSEKCNSDNRLKLDINSNSLSWYNRTIVTHDKLTFGTLVVYSLTQKILARTNLLLGYRVSDKVDASLRIENGEWRKASWPIAQIGSHLDLWTADVVVRHDDNIKYGLEAILNPLGKVPFDQALVVAQYTKDDQTYKVRASSKFDLSLLYRRPALLFKDIATTSIGLHGSNLQNDQRKFKVGLQVEFNV